jgi:hypothetical protein
VRALDERTLADAITRTAPGNYVLGYLDDSDFTPFYVGRSDSDVAVSLREWVDAPSRRRRGRSSCSEPWRMRAVPPRGFEMRLPAGASFGSDTSYTHFAFCYAPSALEAFEQECRDYHDLGGHDGLDNAAHPQPPTDSPWACPLHG